MKDVDPFLPLLLLLLWVALMVAMLNLQMVSEFAGMKPCAPAPPKIERDVR